ncbi:MAG: alkaline phosphatase family protein [Saprospiraceae bacterium]|nr:alkaline phosphatase family protein [Saprospiraceae bacterium]
MAPKIKICLLLLSTICLIISLPGCKTKRSLDAINVDSYNYDPYLILISLDGMRWDYVDRFKPPHLSNFIKKGVKAKSLIPSFPSKTFPNHYTIATGLYPDRHGLLGNNFYNHDKQVVYNIRDRNLVEDGSFYGGSPIWVEAHNAGMVTASFFFVGTEADVKGVRPDYYFRFDGDIKNESRVEQALEWLSMPEEERPRMITMYFSDMDNVGHRYGPNNDLVLGKTLFDLDEVLGQLFRGIEDIGLPVNVIIVSDHGMADVPVDKYIPIEKIQNEELYNTIDNGSIVNIHIDDGNSIEDALSYLKSIEGPFNVYKTASTPYFEYKPENKDWGELQVLPDEGFYFSSLRGINMRKKASWSVFGQHGYNPDIKDMHGIFYARGPAFKKDYTISSVKNIHVFPLMCKILGLEIPKDIDGDLKKIKKVLKDY